MNKILIKNTKYWLESGQLKYNGHKKTSREFIKGLSELRLSREYLIEMLKYFTYDIEILEAILLTETRGILTISPTNEECKDDVHYTVLKYKTCSKINYETFIYENNKWKYFKVERSLLKPTVIESIENRKYLELCIP